MPRCHAPGPAAGHRAGARAGRRFLTAVYLLDPQRSAEMQREDLQPGPVSPRCRYFLCLSVLHQKEKRGLFFWQDHNAMRAG